MQFNRASISKTAAITLVAWLVMVTPAPASSVSLAWDASPDANVVGYALYYGTESGNYTERLDFQRVLTATLTNLTGGLTYYFVVTAYTDDQLESLPSDEVAYITPGKLLVSTTADGSQLALRFPVSATNTWELEASEDFFQWTTLFTTNATTNVWIEFLDPLLGNRPMRFYRVASYPAPP